MSVARPQVRFREGLDPSLLNWGGPDEEISFTCSICDAEIAEDAVPLRPYLPNGWALVLCDGCVKRWILIDAG
jgi:hypothetical protein